MRGKVALLCSDDQRLIKTLTASFSHCGTRAVAANNSVAALAALRAHAADVVVVDTLHFDATDCFDSVDVPTFYLVDSQRDKADTLLQRRAMHTVPRPHGEDSRSLATLQIAVEKMLRRDCFGLQKYLSGFGCELNRVVLRRADQREGELDKLRELLRELRAPRTTIQAIVNATDEMLTNAMYNAPVDEAGNTRYAKIDRREKVTLRPSEHVVLCYGADGTQFGVSVVDNFGQLTHERVLECLHRCSGRGDQIEHKEGGAGLGLYMLFSAAQQTIFNVAPGQRTEAITLWDLRRESKHEPSFHFFFAPLNSSNADTQPAASTRMVRNEVEDELESRFFFGRPLTKRRPRGTAMARPANDFIDEQTLT